MKKTIAIVLVLVLMVSALVGCGKKEEKASAGCARQNLKVREGS